MLYNARQPMKREMKTPRLVQDIRSQPESLRDVLQHHSGAGQDALREAANLIRGTKRVIVTGMGASMFASVPLEYQLCAMAIPTFLVEAGELLHYRHEATAGSVVIIVSRSGESVEIAKLTNLLKGRVPIIGVSNNPSSQLATESDAAIHICSRPDEMIAIQSYTATLLTLKLLASVVAQSLTRELTEAAAAIDQLPAAIERELEHIASWDSFLQSKSPVYVLGRGPSYASVLEGALLFHETAKAPAIGMHAASFRHGPVEMVDASFAGIVFAPAGRTHDLNLALARDLVRFGGKVRIVGPAASGTEGLDLHPTPELPENLAPLVEIIPLQCAALRLAQLRGLEIGAFRYTPQVTKNESGFVN